MDTASWGKPLKDHTCNSQLKAYLNQSSLPGKMSLHFPADQEEMKSG